MKPDNISTNLIVVQRVLDRTGTKQTSLILDVDKNQFYLVDDDDNWYLINQDIESVLNTILESINTINNSIDNCPECIISELELIKEDLNTTNSLVSVDVMDKLNDIEDKLVPIEVEVPVEVIVYQDRVVPVEVPVEVIVYKDKIVKVVEKEYVLTTNTIYVQSPCNTPLPPPNKKVETSNKPIPTNKPPKCNSVNYDNVVWPDLSQNKSQPTRGLSPQTVNGKTVYVETKECKEPWWVKNKYRC